MAFPYILWKCFLLYLMKLEYMLDNIYKNLYLTLDKIKSYDIINI